MLLHWSSIFDSFRYHWSFRVIFRKYHVYFFFVRDSIFLSFSLMDKWDNWICKHWFLNFCWIKRYCAFSGYCKILIRSRGPCFEVTCSSRIYIPSYSSLTCGHLGNNEDWTLSFAPTNRRVHFEPAVRHLHVDSFCTIDM